jgi:hypothetical protein
MLVRFVLRLSTAARGDEALALGETYRNNPQSFFVPDQRGELAKSGNTGSGANPSVDVRGVIMGTTISSAALVGLLLLTIADHHANAAPVSKEDGGTVVITFKDGHQQSIPVSAITSMEFKSASGVATSIAIPAPLVSGKRHYVGKWLVGQGNGDSFYITLEENGEATKSIGAAHGTWVYVDGEARITWDDGWHDAIRKVGSKHEKFAYAPGKSFLDSPTNVTEARNAHPQPI